MTIYEKPRSEVFASNAPESEVSTFTAWLRGLGIAFDETKGLPEMSGLNNVFNLLNQYIKYLEQNGFAEWSSELEYPIGAGVRVGAVWYKAKTKNTNKTPATSQNDWELFLNASALTYENPLYIENNVVKVRGATQTQSGVVQFANDVEIAQKANVSKAVNPANSLNIANGVAIGVGQNWQNVTSQRMANNVYTNDTSKPILVIVSLISVRLNFTARFTINNESFSWAHAGSREGSLGSFSIIIPVGHTYSCNIFDKWMELR